MNAEKWNDNWKIAKGIPDVFSEMSENDGKEWKSISLPYDAMIHEKRTADTQNGHHTGFYPGGTYTYEKEFHAPDEWKDKTVIFEFEGVYMNSSIYINGEYAGGYPSGYTNYYVTADDFLKYGQTNKIRVVVNNSNESNSRWYTGSGIYRNVNIMIGNSLHILLDGAKIYTEEADQEAAVVSLEIPVENMAHDRYGIMVETTIMDQAGSIAGKEVTPVTVFGGKKVSVRQRVYLENPKLWDCDEPNLYRCIIKLIKEGTILDEYTSMIGIRTLSLTPKFGLRINGKIVNLRGACIHHDNGIIGASTLEHAEERRCKQLKEAGFNCIRSSHQPISKAMLDACDRNGMLVIDELSDMWTRSKNDNDYSRYFPEYWPTDAERMVNKDFNHPSVIIYSVGNEIIDINTAKGAEMNRMIADRIKSIDHTRYITSAVNGMLTCRDKIQVILSDILKEDNSFKFDSDNGAGSGSDMLNKMLSLVKGDVEDAMAVHPIMTERLAESSGALDICGLNYLTGRHELEHELNPNRIVLGMETYPADIARLWGIIEKNPHVIGDMTWTGYDYIGESGCGIFYYDGRMGFGENWPASIAYIGDIDIIGNRRPISYYREIVYGLRKEPYIAVQRLNHYGEIPNKTAWMFSDAIPSWTWNGYENQPAIIEIYSDADEVELFLNEKSLGKKMAGKNNNFIATFETLYEPGMIKAVNYRNGNPAEIQTLTTADSDIKIFAEADKDVIKADGADMAYIMVSLRDSSGNVDMQNQKEITVSVKGNASIIGFGSADPETDNSYDCRTWNTYDGYLLAAIRAEKVSGDAVVLFTSSDGLKTEIAIKIEQ